MTLFLNTSKLQTVTLSEIASLQIWKRDNRSSISFLVNAQTSQVETACPICQAMVQLLRSNVWRSAHRKPTVTHCTLADELVPSQSMKRYINQFALRCECQVFLSIASDSATEPTDRAGKRLLVERSLFSAVARARKLGLCDSFVRQVPDQSLVSSRNIYRVS